MIPQQLQHLSVAPRWVSWRYEMRRGHRTKVPYGLNERETSVHDAANLAPAPLVATTGMDGIGLVFLPGQPELGVDLDACIKSDGSLEPWADEIVERLDSYTEVSPSGIGLKVFFTGSRVIEGSRKSVKWASGREKDYEIAYYQGGYFTVTGQVWRTRPVREVAEADLYWLLDRIEVHRTNRTAVKAPGSSKLSMDGLPHELRDLIAHGAPEGGRSDQFHHVVCWLGDLGWTDEQITGLLAEFPDGIASKYIGRLPGEVERCLSKRKCKVAHTGKTNAAPDFDGDISKLFAALALADADVKKMADAEFLIPDMIVRGHVAAYVAPANGGKTTIFVYLAERLVAMGMSVYYINVDASPGDLKRHYGHAAKHGYQVIAPDAKDSMSTQDVIERLEIVAGMAGRCDEVVFIVDTLKKFTDVIDKRQAKEFYRLMRAVTVKGATVCLLGHVNKYAGTDGKTIFEGTGDLRNDLDELIYLDVYKDEGNNILEVTTRPDKVRADFKPKSYQIHLNDDRKVVEPSSVIRIRTAEEREILESIKLAILDGNETQKAIVAAVQQSTTHGPKTIRRALHLFTEGANAEIRFRRTGRGTDLVYSLPAEFEDVGNDIF